MPLRGLPFEVAHTLTLTTLIVIPNLPLAGSGPRAEGEESAPPCIEVHEADAALPHES